MLPLSHTLTPHKQVSSSVQDAGSIKKEFIENIGERKTGEETEASDTYSSSKH